MNNLEFILINTITLLFGVIEFIIFAFVLPHYITTGGHNNGA